ncbi:MAG: DciA family protein [Anderseniella sp.]
MKSLDTHFRRIARPAFEHYGFAQGELVAQWSAIVGEDIASRCSPERLAWPKGRDTSHRHAEAATLTIRADHGTGLALSYETDTLIEKINSFFGYNAISTIKITQTNRAKKQLSTPEAAIATPDIVHTVDVKTSTIENENLKAALARLGQGALAHAASGKKSV